MKEEDWQISYGYINYKKCFDVFGKDFVNLFKKFRDDREFKNRRRNDLNDNLIVQLATQICRLSKVQKLSKVLENPKVGDIFFSVENFEGNEKSSTHKYTDCRIRNRIKIENQRTRPPSTVFSKRILRSGG